MPFITGALISGGASIIGGMMGAGGAESAANTQANAQANSTAVQKQMFDTTNAQQAPYRQAGQNALNTIAWGQNIGPQFGDVTQGEFTHQFNANDLATNLDPSYDFRRSQTLGAAGNLLNLNAGAFSGNALKGVMDYGNNVANTGYQQAFENYNANQSNIFNRLSTIAGLGSTANAQGAQLTGSLAPSIGGSIAATGAAQAGGTVGAANALSGGLNNAGSWYTLNNIMNQRAPAAGAQYGGQQQPQEFGY